MHLLLRWLVCAVSLLIVSKLFKGIRVKSFGSALVAAAVIGLLNAFLGPILHLLSLPLTILTLGLFALVVNAFLFWLAGVFLEGFDVEGGWTAFFGSIVYSLLTHGILAVLWPGTHALL